MDNLALSENNIARLINAADTKLFKRIAEVCYANNLPVFVIGGYVRDLVMGNHSKDIDIVIQGDGNAAAQLVAEDLKVKNIEHYSNFGTAMLQYRNRIIEFVGARKESYDRSSRKPAVQSGSIEDDQNRRDFTINALAISIHPDSFGLLIDPFGGVSDIQNGIIKTPLEPAATFSDDPLRIMRAIRFASRFQFQIEEKTWEAIADTIDRLEIVSKERIADELNKTLQTEKPSLGLSLLYESGIMECIIPALSKLKGVEENEGLRHKDNFIHTLEVVDKIASHSDNLWLRWAALLHDIGKPRTKRFEEGIGWTFHGHDAVGAKMVEKIIRSLRLPLNEKMKYVQKLVALHLRPISLSNEEVTDSAVRRLLFDAGDEINDLMMLCEADITSKNKEKVKRYLKNFADVRQRLIDIEEKDKLRNWQPPISGEEIMSTFNIPPSKDVGIIKEAIKEAILEGTISNNYQEARDFMLIKAKEMGIFPK